MTIYKPVNLDFSHDVVPIGVFPDWSTNGLVSRLSTSGHVVLDDGLLQFICETWYENQLTIHEHDPRVEFYFDTANALLITLRQYLSQIVRLNTRTYVTT